MTEPPSLEVTDLVKHFDGEGRLFADKNKVHAVDGVSFTLGRGEVLGLVGESGSGKSTVAHCVARLVEPTSGTIRLGGVDITHLPRGRLRPLRQNLHMVFQDPTSSLDPHMTCGDIVAEPLRLHHLARGRERDVRVAAMFDDVGLRQEFRHRHPHELSGGERQRVSLARALVIKPTVLIADEPLSALDVSVQASILNLLRDLQRNLRFSCLFITHDLSTVEFLCDRVAVMYLGKVVETAPKAELFTSPQHPYTQALLAAAVVPDPRAMRARNAVPLETDVSGSFAPPSGCRYHPRCPLLERSRPRSEEEEPELRECAPQHFVACHLVEAQDPASQLAEPSVGVSTL
jgi:oligopeptide/dipeptide ABC transporter ATP-binding protein